MISYLFGAGASAGNGLGLYEKDASGIPIVKNFNKDLSDFVEQNIGESRRDNNVQAVSFWSQFRPLTYQLTSTFSFDTLAKKLWLKGDYENLGELKRLLNSYILFRQYSTKRDVRYDLFFATLMGRKGLPEKINFFSYNYDLNIEISLSTFDRHSSYISFIRRYPCGDGVYYHNEFPALFKLNGSAGFVDDNGHNKLNFGKISSEGLIDLVRNNYSNYKNLNAESPITFSWESINTPFTIPEIKKNLMDTKELIIIGYSFPTINYENDKKFIELLPTSVKIGLQVADGFEGVSERLFALLHSIRPNEWNKNYSPIFEIKETDQFYISNNLYNNLQ